MSPRTCDPRSIIPRIYTCLIFTLSLLLLITRGAHSEPNPAIPKVPLRLSPRQRVLLVPWPAEPNQIALYVLNRIGRQLRQVGSPDDKANSQLLSDTRKAVMHVEQKLWALDKPFPRHRQHPLPEQSNEVSASKQHQKSNTSSPPEKNLADALLSCGGKSALGYVEALIKEQGIKPSAVLIDAGTPPSITENIVFQKRILAGISVGLQLFGEQLGNHSQSNPSGQVMYNGLIDFGREQQRLPTRPANSLAADLWDRLASKQPPLTIEIKWTTSAKAKGTFAVKLILVPDQLLVNGKVEPSKATPHFEWISKELGGESGAPSDAIMLGPTFSGTVRNFKAAGVFDESSLGGSAAHPTMNAVTPSATASVLTEGSESDPLFYRNIAPDGMLARRLAHEVVSSIRPKQIAIVFADTLYGQGLKKDFSSEVSRQSKCKIIPIIFPEPLAEQPTTIKQPVKPSNSDVAGMKESRTLVRILDQISSNPSDVIALFCLSQDKRTILEAIRIKQRQNSKGFKVPIVTTDFDEAYPATEVPELLIASTVNPDAPSDDDLLGRCNILFAGSLPTARSSWWSMARPDIYMIQYARTSLELLRVMQDAVNSGRTAEQVLKSLRGAEPHEGFYITHKGFTFAANGDPAPERYQVSLSSVQDGIPITLDPPPAELWVSWIWEPIKSGVAAYLWLAAILIVAVLWVYLIRPDPNTSRNGIQKSRGSGYYKRRPRRTKEDAHTGVLGSFRRQILYYYERVTTRLNKAPLLAWLFIGYLLFSIFLVSAWHERAESIAFIPNAYSVCPAMFIRSIVCAVLGWGFFGWWTEKRKHLWSEVQIMVLQSETLTAGNGRDIGILASPDRWRQLRKEISRAWSRDRPNTWSVALVILVVVVAMTSSEWFNRPPIGGNHAYTAYALVSIPLQIIFASGLIFIYRVKCYAQDLAASFPIPERLEPRQLGQIVDRVRRLVSPFVDVTLYASLAYVLLLFTRSRVIDHWVWTDVFMAVYGGVFIWLYVSIWGMHVAWRSTIIRAKSAAEVGTASSSEPSSLVLHEVSDWPWDARGPLKATVALVAPVVALTLQNVPIAAELLRGVLNVVFRSSP